MARKPKKLKTPIWFDEIAAEEFKRVEKILREEEVDFTPKDIKCLEAYAMNYSKWMKDMSNNVLKYQYHLKLNKK